MAMTFSQTPQLYGTFHLIFTASIFAACLILWFPLKKLDSATLLRLIGISGAVMIVMEIWKQWFSFTYVDNGIFSMWFFPWQLCSMSMYCSTAVPFIKDSKRETLLVFMATFSLFAAIMALAVPADMLRPQILLTCHGFIFHGIMMLQSLASIIILSRRKNVRFVPAVWLFAAMAAVAEIINVVSHHALHNIKREPNMFNITLYYPSTQPVFHDIAVSLGIIPEILIYLTGIVLVCWGIFILERRFPADREK